MKPALTFCLGLFLTVILAACGTASDTPVENSTDPEGDDTPCLSSNSLTLDALFNCKKGDLPDDEVNSSEVAWLILDRTYLSHRQWNGVGRYGGCTGTLLDVGGTGDDPAYVITNGHCVGADLIAAKGVYFDMAASPHKAMAFNYFYADVKAGTTDSYTDASIVFASMDHTDVAIVELKETYEALIEQGYSSFSLSTVAPNKGEAVTVVGVPLTGVTNYGLRKSNCTIGERVTLNEGDYVFSHSYRHTCSIVGGNSGSPVFDRETKAIVALVNTTVDDSSKNSEDCALQRPCEVSSSGTKTVNESYNYAQPVYYLSKCFSSGRFNRNLSTCQATLFESIEGTTLR